MHDLHIDEAKNNKKGQKYFLEGLFCSGFHIGRRGCGVGGGIVMTLSGSNSGSWSHILGATIYIQ